VTGCRTINFDLVRSTEQKESEKGVASACIAEESQAACENRGQTDADQRTSPRSE